MKHKKICIHLCKKKTKIISIYFEKMCVLKFLYPSQDRFRPGKFSILTGSSQDLNIMQSASVRKSKIQLKTSVSIIGYFYQMAAECQMYQSFYVYTLCVLVHVHVFENCKFVQFIYFFFGK